MNKNNNENYLTKIKNNKFLIISIFLAIFLGITIYFFILKNIEFEKYKENAKQDSELAKIYKEELLEREIEKKNEIKNLKELTLDNIQNIPKNKKELLLNIIPSGKPFKKHVKINSYFGLRVHPISRRKKMHNGLDLKVNIGDDIMTTAMGKVIFAGTQRGSGKMVIIEHSFGFRTSYSHLNKINVKLGQIVGKGKVIGEGGNTGLSTGPHLHYEVEYYGRELNPKPFMDWNEKNFNSLFIAEKNVSWEKFLTIIGKN